MRTTKTAGGFGKWLDVFLSEKGIDEEEILAVESSSGAMNWIPVGVLVVAMKQAPSHEQRAIKAMFVKIDFMNAPVRKYLAHLAKAIAYDPGIWTEVAS